MDREGAREVDADPGCGGRVVRGVRPGAAVEGIRPAEANEGVVPRPTLEEVGIGVAGENVGIGRADDILDRDEDVAVGIATRSHPGGEVHGDGEAGGGIVGGVGACTAVEGIRAPAADQGVVAGAAGEEIGVAVTGQTVVVGRADDVLDVEDRIAVRIAADIDSRREVDRDRGARSRVVCRIDAGAAVEGVRPRAALEGVVAVAASESASRRRGDEGVGEGRADHALDGHQRVPGRVTAGAGPRGEANRHGCGGGGVVGNIRARAAVEGIGTRATRQSIVAGATGEKVGVGIASQAVGKGRSREVLDVEQHVACGVAAGIEVCREIHGHPGGGSRVGGGIGTGAAVEGVRPRATRQGVVASAAGEEVGGGVAGEGVRVGRTDEVLDQGEGIALRVAPRGRPGSETHRHRGGRGRIIRGVRAHAAVEGVVAGPRHQGVVAGFAFQEVARGASGADERDQAVVIGRPENGLEVGDDIPRSVAGGDLGGGQVEVHGHAGRGVRIGEGVRAGAAVQGVRPAEAFDGVVAGAAEDRVGRRAAGQRVVVGGAREALDVQDAVAGRVAARRGPGGEVHRHGGVRQGVADDIRPGAAVEAVCPRPGDQGVVARAGLEASPRGRRIEGVREGGTDDVLEAGIAVARGMAPEAGARSDGAEGAGLARGG